MAASKCKSVGCTKGLGPSKIKAGVRYCDEHMPGRRQCTNSTCETWLLARNKSGYCSKHKSPAERIRKDAVRKQYPERWLLHYARHRAKKKGVPFTVTEADISIPSYCPVLGTPLDNSGGPETNPSIDRIDPELGYTPGNVWVISRQANSMKWDATPGELLAFSNYWIGQLSC